MQFRIQLLFYNLSRNQKFDIFIMIFIMLNMLTMAIEFEGMSEDYTRSLEIVNLSFLTIFTLECVIKLLGLRLYYFKEPWNVFDFVVVVVSLLSEFNLLSGASIPRKTNDANSPLISISLFLLRPPSFPSTSVSFPFLALSILPSLLSSPNPAKGLEDCCKLPQRGQGGAPAEKAF